MLTGTQIMYQIFSVFDIDKTRRRAMRFSDFLNIELRNYNFKKFNQEWDEVQFSLDEKCG